MKLPQLQLPIWVGGFKTQYIRSQTYWSMVMYIVSFLNFRALYINSLEWLRNNFIVGGIILFGIAFLMLIDYVLFIKTDNTYNAHQNWKAQNPTVITLLFLEIYNQEAFKKLGIHFTHEELKLIQEETMKRIKSNKILPLEVLEDYEKN